MLGDIVDVLSDGIDVLRGKARGLCRLVGVFSDEGSLLRSPVDVFGDGVARLRGGVDRPRGKVDLVRAGVGVFCEGVDVLCGEDGLLCGE